MIITICLLCYLIKMEIDRKIGGITAVNAKISRINPTYSITIHTI